MTMQHEMSHGPYADDAALEAILRMDADQLRRATPPAFTARVMRKLPARPAVDEHAQIGASGLGTPLPMNISPVRFAQFRLAAAVVALAVLSGMYFGAPWGETTNETMTEAESPNIIASSEMNPTLIRRPRVTINLGVGRALQQEASRFLAQATTFREVLIHRLPLQGQAAERDSSS